ncbi:MAG TPA: pyridoxamine 5'-phosphate oxidase family protein [Pyrinomonadaceae bacterium]|nr:pyridoxamine 5'-phosphate oxidase family protein [Pyrinomonadaceae bacterium]
MAKFFSELDDATRDFIREQKIFFTATAPAEGRINLSPKGMDTFRCLDSKRVAYLDLTGSGNETAAHILENGRLTIMFCSFSERPLILRLYGRGRVVRPRDAEWGALHEHFPPAPGERQIIVLDLESAQTSCGFAVPVYELKEERPMLIEWTEKKGEEGIRKYWREKNQTSIDGLPTRLCEG